MKNHYKAKFTETKLKFSESESDFAKYMPVYTN